MVNTALIFYQFLCYVACTETLKWACSQICLNQILTFFYSSVYIYPILTIAVKLYTYKVKLDIFRCYVNGMWCMLINNTVYFQFLFNGKIQNNHLLNGLNLVSQNCRKFYLYFPTLTQYDQHFLYESLWFNKMSAGLFGTTPLRISLSDSGYFYAIFSVI